MKRESFNARACSRPSSRSSLSYLCRNSRSIENCWRWSMFDASTLRPNPTPSSQEGNWVRNPGTKSWLLLVGIALLALPARPLQAQSIFAGLTGVVSDASGAIVPGAAVRLINEKSGSTRTTVADSVGYYSFASVSVGDFTYKLVVSAPNFGTYQATGLELLGGQKRNLNVELKVGAASQTVEVTGAVTNIVPVDSGEKSQTLTTKELTDYVQVGSD